MDAGSRDKNIIIQRNTPTQNAYGEEIEHWATLVDCWAMFVPLPSIEKYRAARELSSTVGDFIIGSYSGITVEDRVSWNSIYWDITAVAEVRRGGDVRISVEVKQ